MKHFVNPFLSFAAPLLILLAMFVFIHREGSDRLQALPALIVGVGLIISGALGRFRRRKQLLFAIRKAAREGK